jgi:PKHD-type hydroxylase
MLLSIEKVLDPEEVRQFRQHLATAEWTDGAQTAGALARLAKHNQQLPDSVEPALSLGRHILRKLGVHPLFISAALPRKIYPPKFNKYEGGGNYAAHIDNAVMPIPGTHTTLRSDLSATLFLSEPDEYDGGELEIEGALGVQSIKLEAGDLILYPATSLHRVTPVTRGARIASFFWVESLVADESHRTLLFDLDQTIQSLTSTLPAGDAQVLKLTGIYHNLLRGWATT